MWTGRVVADRFQIEALAGRGGMGTVFRARDLESGEPVALKLLHDEGDTRHSDRFLREARVLAELRHPGIVRYVAHGAPGDGRLFLAMEWLEGEDLSQRLVRGPLPLGDALLVVERAAEALAAAHAQGVIHRDIKPSNLFLVGGELGRVKLLDFGIARMSRATQAMTGTAVMLGTPGYMAPEQAKGERTLDARADVFALGCVLFECLTGRPAFAGAHPMAILAKILLEEAPRLHELMPAVPPALDALVARMLAKSPAERPRDARALAQELERLDREAAPDSAWTAPRSEALTEGERRLFSVVLVGVDRQAAATDETLLAASLEARASDAVVASLAPTLTVSEAQDDELLAVAAAFEARLERLVGGSMVLTLAGAGAATDQAARAARCALRMRGALGEAPIALATGFGVLAHRWPVGEVIDRAVQLLQPVGASGARQDAAPHRVHIDEVTAGLLGGRFEVEGDEGGLYVVAEHDLHEETGRTLLGKPTDCVGRERELAMLDATYDECAGEPVARAVLLSAPAGVGKSRLRQEWQRRLGDRGELPQVLFGRGDMMSAGSPFALLAPVIRRLAGLHEGEPLDVRQRKLRARVARHVAPANAGRVAEFLGEMAGTPFPAEESVQLRAARQDPRLMGDQMQRAWVDLLAAECAAGPVVLVLEDVHWGDPPSVAFVDAALRTLGERPLFVLATARPEVHDIFPRLWEERGVQEIRVTGLGRRASERLVQQVLGVGVEAGVVARIVEQAAGNAFYLEELIRATADGKGEALPGTVLAMVQARLEGMESDARRILRAASVFGEAFWRGGLLALLGGEDHAEVARDWLQELERRELLARRAEGKFHLEQEYAFRHSIVREAAYAMLTDGDRALGHRLAGTWLEGAGESDAMILAEHFDRGGEAGRAVGWFARAAEQALEANDFPAAVARAERGVALGAAGEALGALRLAQAAAHRWRGEHHDAERRGAEALALLPRASDRWYACVVELAMAYGAIGGYGELVRLAHDLASIGPLSQASSSRVQATVYTIGPLLLSGQRDKISDLLESLAGLKVDSLADQPATYAQVRYVRALLSSMLGDASAAIDHLHAVIESQMRAGDLRTVCMNRSNLGFALLECGLHDAAEEALRAALPEAERLGIRNAIANIKSNLAVAVALQGKLDEAIELERQAVELFCAQGHLRLELTARVYLSVILSRAGRADEAETEASRALDLATNDGLRLRALPALAQARLAQGKATEALEAALEGTALLARVGSIDEGEALLRLVLAESFAALGRTDEARAAVMTALTRLRERAALIGHPDRRRSFLQHVPENAKMLSLAGELGLSAELAAIRSWLPASHARDMSFRS